MRTTHSTLLLLLILPLAAHGHEWHTEDWNGPMSGENRRDLRVQASGNELGVAGLEYWQFGLDLDALVNQKQPVDAPANARSTGAMDVESFLLTGQGDGLSFRVGQHQAAEESLLFKGDSRWGYSADARIDPLNAEVSLFGVQAPETGADGEFQGLARQGDRFRGGTLRSAVDTSWSDMVLTARYVSGREYDTADGNARGSRALLGEGAGYSLGLDSAWFGNQLNLALERALTRYLPNEEDDTSLSGSAYAASLLYRPDLNAESLGWEIGAELSTVDDNFRSPANNGLPQDRSTERVFSRLSGERWAIRSSLGREERNLARDQELPIARDRRQQLGMSYQSADLLGLSWLSDPAYDLEWERAVRHHRYQPDSFVVTGANGERVEQVVTLSSRYRNPIGSSSVGYSHRTAEGRGDSPLDARGRAIFADATLAFSDRLRIEPAGRFQREENEAREDAVYHTFVSLSANTWLIPDQLSYSQKIAFNRTRGTDDPQLIKNDGQRYLSGELQWHAIAPVRNRPGLDLNLSFSADQLRATRDNGGGLDSYQVLLSLESRLPGS